MLSAETRRSFRTVFRWTLPAASPYLRGMKRKNPEAGRLAESVVRTVAAAGPVGWMALVACASLALAANAIYAILTVVRTAH